MSNCNNWIISLLFATVVIFTIIDSLECAKLGSHFRGDSQWNLLKRHEPEPEPEVYYYIGEPDFDFIYQLDNEDHVDHHHS